MTAEHLQQLETDLASRGYRKYTSALSSKESYGWFKSWKDHNGEIIYTIEWRVWECLPESSLIDILIIDKGGNHRIDLEIASPKFDIPTVEDIAFSLHNMLQPYI